MKREEFRHIRQLRELLWFPPDDARVEVRYPRLEKKEAEDVPGYTDFVKKNDPETGKENKAYLDRNARLAILRTPWQSWHPISRKASGPVAAPGVRRRATVATPPRAGEGERGSVKEIFVGNLSFKVREEQVVELFSPYGAVHAIHYVTHRSTGRFRGFCFITVNEKDADEAIESLNGRRFMGRPMNVNEAKKEKR